MPSREHVVSWGQWPGGGREGLRGAQQAAHPQAGWQGQSSQGPCGPGPIPAPSIWPRPGIACAPLSVWTLPAPTKTHLKLTQAKSRSGHLTTLGRLSCPEEYPGQGAQGVMTRVLSCLSPLLAAQPYVAPSS